MSKKLVADFERSSIALADAVAYWLAAQQIEQRAQAKVKRLWKAHNALDWKLEPGERYEIRVRCGLAKAKP